jgi:endonuclease YncB( thermonuclease family)
MKFLEAMIAWNPNTDEVDVGPWPDRSGWSRRYRRTVGACFTELRDMSGEERERRLFIDFNTLVVRDGVPPAAAHKAFLKIDEYRSSISPDMPGAEGGDVWG